MCSELVSAPMFKIVVEPVVTTRQSSNKNKFIVVVKCPLQGHLSGPSALNTSFFS
jgi:hypothetical protein